MKEMTKEEHDFLEKSLREQMQKEQQNKMPAGQGQRHLKRPRHDLIPLEFLDELALIFEEGLSKYEDSWKDGGVDFIIDCLNHASNHLFKAMNNDWSEMQLPKVAWNVLVVQYHIRHNPELLDKLAKKGKKSENV